MSRHNARPNSSRFLFQSLEQRTLLSGGLLLDFGPQHPTTYPATSTHTSMSDRFVAGTSITTPAHEVGGLAANYNTYNNIGKNNIAADGLVWGDGTTADGVTLTWGRSSTRGGPITYGDTSNLKIPDEQPANAADLEFNNPILNNFVMANAAQNGEMAVSIDNLPAGTYDVYVVANRLSTETWGFAPQIGRNLDQYDADLAQLSLHLHPDGTFTAPGEYVKQRVTIDSNDTLDVIVRSLGGYGAPPDTRQVPRLNLIEIVPVNALSDTTATPAHRPQLAVHTGSTQPARADAFGDWLGVDSVWAMDFLPYKTNEGGTWENLANPSWMLDDYEEWKTNHPNEKFVLAVPMGMQSSPTNVLSLGAAGNYDAHYANLAKNLLNAGLNDTVIRLGWEFNGDWYPWKVGTDYTNFKNFWIRIVDAMRNPENGPNNQLTFCWNPSYGNSPNLASAYPGDLYVDSIGIDVYDQDFASPAYYNFTGLTADEIEVRHQASPLKAALNVTNGLKDLAELARSHGKPLSIPEMGVWTRDASTGGGDNPFFIEMMHAFVTDPGNRVDWVGYFEYGDVHGISPGTSGHWETEFPRAASAFKRLFGVNPIGEDVLKVDFDSNQFGASPTQDGWSSFSTSSYPGTSTPASNTFGASHVSSGSVTVRLAASTNWNSWTYDVNGHLTNGGGSTAKLISRDRGEVSGGVTFGNSGLYRDLTAVNNAALGIELAGLDANTTYAVTFYRYDDDNTGDMTFRNMTSGTSTERGTIRFTQDHFFATDNDYSTTLVARSNAQGRLFFNGISSSGSGAINGLAIQTVLGRDIGTPSVSGTTVYNPSNGSWTLTSNGTGMQTTPDQFHFAAKRVSGDQTLVARLDAFDGTATASRAGVMMRNGTGTADAYAAVVMTPGGVAFQYRAGSGAASSIATTATGPVWVKLTRTTNTNTTYDIFTAYYATTASMPGDGDWKIIRSAGLNFGSTYQAGLVAASGASGDTAVAQFSEFSLVPSYAAPSNWSSRDIGSTVLHGSTQYTPWGYTMTASGTGITGTSDQFHYASTSTTDTVGKSKVLIVRIDSLDNASGIAKAGVMFRNSTSAGAANIALTVRPSDKVVQFSYRSADGDGSHQHNSTTLTHAPSPGHPLWLKLVKNGSTFTAYYVQTAPTTPGSKTEVPTNWSQLGSSLGVTLGTSYLAGFAATSGSNSTPMLKVDYGWSELRDV